MINIFQAKKIKNKETEDEELNHIVLGIGLFTSIKRHLFYTKEHLDNPEGQLEVDAFLIGSCFQHF